MSAQHTPGPWKYEIGITDAKTGEPCHPITNANGLVLADVIESHEDGYLIAAAPELLDTCEALAAFTRDLLKLLTPEQIKAAKLTTRMLKLNDKAYNVLAKARGEK